VKRFPRQPNSAPEWFKEEERIGIEAALRGKPKSASKRFREFIEKRQGQQRLFDEAKPS
jgi:hypothetical protein